MANFRIDVSEAGKVMTVHIQVFFDYSFSTDFKELSNQLHPPIETCYLNLTKADYMCNVS